MLEWFECMMKILHLSLEAGCSRTLAMQTGAPVAEQSCCGRVLQSCYDCILSMRELRISVTIRPGFALRNLKMFSTCV